MKIEDRKSCEYRFSSILINFHQFLSIISIVNDNRFIMISDTFVLHNKYRLLQITRDPAIFPVFLRIDNSNTENLAFSQFTTRMPLLDC